MRLETGTGTRTSFETLALEKFKGKYKMDLKIF